MSKKYFRFYWGFIVSQENWLNKMAASGYRLITTTKSCYEFEKCEPGKYQYRVEYIGQKSTQDATDYVYFLEDYGYRVFFKNINLNYSYGKLQVRPWADKGGRIATNSSTYNRELLIVEKTNDGKPFCLHTTYKDKQHYYKCMRKSWIFLLVVSAILGVFLRHIIWGGIAILSIIVLFAFQVELTKLRKQADRTEW